MNTPEIVAHFDRLCAAVQERGDGLSLDQLGDAHALARELEAEEPSAERVELFRERLGLDPEEVAP